MKKIVIIAMMALSCKSAASAADAACEALIAYNDTPLEESICATLDDFVILGNLVLGSRHSSDGGVIPRTAGKCTNIPHTNVCATDAEIAAAIKARKASTK